MDLLTANPVLVIFSVAAVNGNSAGHGLLLKINMYLNQLVIRFP